MNTDHIHKPIIMNSVNFETGRKLHQSAQYMGLPVATVKIGVYAISGFCAALGGVLFSS